MNAATLGIASDFVKAGIEKAGIPLSATLEAYLSLTFARFIGQSITVDLLTVRVTQAMDAQAPREVIRALADECLIACAFFERRLQAERQRAPLCRPRPGELRRRPAHRAGLRLRPHARRDRQRRVGRRRGRRRRSSSTAPAPAARRRGASSPGRTWWSAPGAARRAACSGAEPQAAAARPRFRLTLPPAPRGPVELAELVHHADEHAGGPAEGEEARHGDDRSDQPPAVRQLDVARPERGVALQHEVVAVAHLRDHPGGADRHRPDQRLGEMRDRQRRDGDGEEQVHPPVRRVRR